MALTDSSTWNESVNPRLMQRLLRPGVFARKRAPAVAPIVARTERMINRLPLLDAVQQRHSTGEALSAAATKPLPIVLPSPARQQPGQSDGTRRGPESRLAGARLHTEARPDGGAAASTLLAAPQRLQRRPDAASAASLSSGRAAPARAAQASALPAADPAAQPVAAEPAAPQRPRRRPDAASAASPSSGRAAPARAAQASALPAANPATQPVASAPAAQARSPALPQPGASPHGALPVLQAARAGAPFAAGLSAVQAAQGPGAGGSGAGVGATEAAPASWPARSGEMPAPASVPGAGRGRSVSRSRADAPLAQRQIASPVASALPAALPAALPTVLPVSAEPRWGSPARAAAPAPAIQPPPALGRQAVVAALPVRRTRQDGSPGRDEAADGARGLSSTQPVVVRAGRAAPASTGGLHPGDALAAGLPGGLPHPGRAPTSNGSPGGGRDRSPTAGPSLPAPRPNSVQRAAETPVESTGPTLAGAGGAGLGEGTGAPHPAPAVQPADQDDQLDTMMRKMLRRLAAESERRGLTPWT